MQNTKTRAPLAKTSTIVEQHQEALQFEIKQALLYGPSLDIYLLPRLDSATTCNALLLIRHGHYKGASFKLEIDFKRFPHQPPTCMFLTRVFHPLIDFDSGKLDVDAVLSEEWDGSNPTMTYQLLNNLPGIFTDSEVLKTFTSLNPNASLLFVNNPRQFMVRALQSVQESVDRVSEEEEGWSLNFGEGQAEEVMNLKEELLLAKETEGSIEDKIKLFLSKVLLD